MSAKPVGFGAVCKPLILADEAIVQLRFLTISHASLIVHGNKLDGSSKTCIARRDFSLGKTGRSSRDSMYCPANCRALSSNNGSFSRSATRLMALCSFGGTSPKIVCCNFCKGLFLKAGWRWVDRNSRKNFVICNRRRISQYTLCPV